MDQVVEEGIDIQIGRLPSYLKANQQDEICATIVDDDNTGTVGDDTINQLASSALSARQSQQQHRQSRRRRRKMILSAIAVFAVLLIVCASIYYGVCKSKNNGDFGAEGEEILSSSMMEALDDQDDLHEYEVLSMETSKPSPAPVILTISNDFEVGQPQTRRRTDDDDDSEW